jgi:hypothetical protein
VPIQETRYPLGDISVSPAGRKRNVSPATSGDAAEKSARVFDFMNTFQTLRTYVAFSIDAHKRSCIFMSHVVFLCQQAFRRRLTRSPAEVARKSSGEAPRE